MPNTRIGKLLPRYSLLVNSHAEVRLSKCPKCRKATHLRKFALFIHIDESGPKMLGKTYRYCSRCAMVMAQRAELEAALAHGFEPNSTASHGKALFGAWHHGKENMAGGTGRGSQAARQDVRARG
jgi:Zn-finger nucleic acid-binding protein